MAAEWTDDNTRIIVELFVKQVRKGNRPNTHLTPNGYEEVANEFKEITGKEYKQAQFKNKWDKLKYDYNIFKKLRLRETGGGWDSVKNTVKQDAEWWKKAKKDIPGCGKFKTQGLRNEEGLKEMFEDITSDGTDHWNPSSGVPPPSSAALADAINVDAIEDLDNENTEEQPSPGDLGGSTARVKRLGKVVLDGNKKPRTALVMQEQITRIGDKKPRIKNDRRAYPHLKNCIGAIDGTHIRAVIAPHQQVRYIGRTGAVTQNVMAICDFDMHFTYASIGQPGAMHDTSVLYHAIDKDRDTFPHPPKGKYYLVDAGYPNRFGYLAPYKGERYHVPDFHRGVPPTTPVEKLNRIHSSKRNIIECGFGVLKMKWQTLLKMPKYSIETQKMIVAACMTLHNYIRAHDRKDIHFERFDRDPDYVPVIPDRYKRYVVPPGASDSSTSEANGADMDDFRDELATAIAQGW